MKQILLLLLIFPFYLSFSNSTPNVTKKETTLQKVEIINKSFDQLVEKLTKEKEDNNSIWNIIGPLLIGSALTLVTQLLIDSWKNRKEKVINQQKLISRGRAKTYLIVQILKDLAMYKVHKQYYLRAYQIGNDEDDFKKHYEKGQQQRETETKLDDNIAEYFQIVTEYAILTKNIDHFQEHFQDIFNFHHAKSSKFTNCQTLTQLTAELETEEINLNNKYLKLIEILEKIQKAMK
ncbi:hypothetical protein [Flavobacterium branchiicola]|uniref:DUF4129 domain-containing protein n=1 Tax=Flavobacterium branchiicola TaxID=1114875 RepID=A0ABV9PHQ0_9FLAO|nr:hypothetical protein [Flavobacterium branchiicola]MBS7254865.1 hypothetical protein [Flavobacterium branchiicola]